MAVAAQLWGPPLAATTPPPPVVVDGTGLTSTVPLTVKNAKSESGIELWYTGTIPTAYALMNASGTIKGGLGIATASNDWVTGSTADDVVAFVATGKKLLVAGKGATLPIATFDPATNGSRVLVDSTGLANAIPVKVVNGKAFSGVELNVSGSAATGYLIRNASAAHVGGLAVCANAADWATGVVADDIILQGKGSGKVYVASVSGGTPVLTIDIASGGVAQLSTALATGATAGFFQTRTMAGTPTGAVNDGCIVVDTSGSKIWVRVGGAWKSVAVA